MRFEKITSRETGKMVLLMRIELTTSPLPRECSTTELQQRARNVGAMPDQKRPDPTGAQVTPLFQNKQAPFPRGQND
jgi:hypothetical protein